jgi:hypothetical protein
MTATVEVTTKRCAFCRKSTKMTLPQEGYNKWQAGAFVQVAFPRMSPADRELLITGVDSKCWDANMKEPEDD